MDGSVHFRPSSRPLGALFEEDFDQPERVAEPDAIEPVYSAADLTNLSEAAWREGNAAGQQEAAASDAATTRRAIESLAAQCTDARDAATARAEQTADAIARLLLDSLAAAFPVLCACYGEAEVQAIVRSVLPALTQEQVVTVRTNRLTAPALVREIGRLDPALAARVQIVECDAMTPGDVKIDWHNGRAIRDATALWEQVAAVLAPAGLLRTDVVFNREETVNGD
jgi:flagellar biosynthesis/type III secretory pathway protein FliH